MPVCAGMTVVQGFSGFARIIAGLVFPLNATAARMPEPVPCAGKCKSNQPENMLLCYQVLH
jgi:hypothetical protein